MRVAARAATTRDLPALGALLSDCAAAVGSERGGRHYVGRELIGPPYATRLRALISSPDVLLMSGTLDEAVFAVALARIETLTGGGRLGRLELLFVDPEAREVGLGEALVREAISWAGEQGAEGLDAYALPGNREAKNFLESSGFTARLIVMHRDLTGLARP
jgi:GNAT superfamily N-acetyltransferase